MSLPPPLQNNIRNSIRGTGGLQGIRAGTNITISGTADFPTITSTAGGTGTTTSSTWTRDTSNVVLTAALQNLFTPIVFTPTQTGFAVVQVDIFYLATSGTTNNVDSYLFVNGVNLNLGAPFRINTTGSNHILTCDFSWRFAVTSGTPYTIVVQANLPGGAGAATKDDITMSVINTA